MRIIEKLASSLNRRDEVPNQELAKQIANKKDKAAIKELIELLNNKSKDIQSDSIKVLYEIGEQEPSLIAEYAKNFIALLDSKNNRLQWGTMTALDSITSENPKEIYKALPKIIKGANNGSVITKDRAVNILIKLCDSKQYEEDAFALLVEQLLNSPNKSITNVRREGNANNK
jgi:HEAT repeat protein